MCLDDLRMGLPRSKSQPLTPLVRHERLRKPRESSPLPSEEAGRARLAGGRHASERRDDALAVDLEDPLLLTTHERDVELAFIAGPAASRASGFARERHPMRYLRLEADRAVRRPRQCRNRTERTPRPQRTRPPRWVGHVSENDVVLDDLPDARVPTLVFQRLSDVTRAGAR